MRTGGCLCGALRFSVSGEPKLVVQCFCEDCRRESGSDHLTHMSVAIEQVAIHGESRNYDAPHPNGMIRRVFCPSCGTTILGMPASMPDEANVRMGTLDDVGDLKPSVAVFVSRVRGWTRVDPALEQHAELTSVA